MCHSLTLTTAWTSQGRALPFLETLLLFLASHLLKWAWDSHSLGVSRCTLLAALPVTAGHPSQQDSVPLPAGSGSLPCMAASPNPLTLSGRCFQTRAAKGPRQCNRRWFEKPPTGVGDDWNEFLKNRTYVLLFPVLKHKSSQLRQLPVSRPNYFPGERKIKEADRLSLGEICKLKKV